REQVSARAHAAWLLLSLPATLVLWRRSRADRSKRVSLLVFGMSLTLCYAGSTLYDAIRLSVDLVEGWFSTLDYIGIYLLMAGTMTPVAVVVLPRVVEMAHPGRGLVAGSGRHHSPTGPLGNFAWSFQCTLPRDGVGGVTLLLRVGPHLVTPV